MRISTITFLLAFATLPILAQEIKVQEIDLQSFVENVFSNQDQDVNYGELYETLLQYVANPIDLNKTNREELRSLFILNEIQLNSFFNYANKAGKLISIYELQSIPNFDQQTIEHLLPFVQVSRTKTDTRPLVKRVLNEENNYLLVRYQRTLEEKKGYKSRSATEGTPYVGDPNNLYMRLRTSKTNDFSFGFTAEKDSGEKLIWDQNTKRYGMDYYSFHAQLKNKGIIKNILIGDYQIQSGQSLLLNSGFSVGKGAETITTIRRNQLGIRPYTSVIESNFFRGAASTIQVGQFDITGFYSNRLNDAILQRDSTSTAFETFTNSIQYSGMHRTTSGIASKQTLRVQNSGGTLFYKSNQNNIQLGANFIFTQFDSEIRKTTNYYNQFEFNGATNYNYSLSGSYQWQNINVFGEIAQSKSKGIGAVGGILASLTHNVDVSILLRHYDQNFHSFYGNAFGESNRNNNESGIYWGAKYRINSKWKISSYYDKFNFPWLKYQVKSPSNGSETMAKVEYSPLRHTRMYVQFREEQKEKIQYDEDLVIPQIHQSKKQNYIFNIDYPASDNIKLKTRFQFSSNQIAKEKSNGYLLLQDISTNYRKFNVSGRYAIFNTDNYDNRQYVYEKDVLYAFSIPAYSGKGIRTYLLLSYKFNAKVKLQGKYSITTYRDRKVISSGNEEINGNMKQDIKLQLKISL